VDPLDRLGRHLPAAVIAAEDQRFAQHAGIDDVEVARVLARLALVDDGDVPRGASTLTQQLARTLFTGGERTLSRKLRETLYALEMERTLGKQRILELYLNTVDWGPGLCGARAAARAYFAKAPARLDPLEAAWLAAILRHPHRSWREEFVERRPDRTAALAVHGQRRDLSRRERAQSMPHELRLAEPPPRGPSRGVAQRR
jgi:membrane peptidoglycan carboxypeptidase